MDCEEDFIRVGSNVIIDLNGSKYSFVRIRQNGTVKVAGSNCSTEPLIGARFGSSFLLDEHKELIPADTNPHETIANATGTSTEKNNSDLVGQNSNQSLTHDEVLELKQQHKGPEILKALQDGSTTFAGKTEFSQEKWLKKKAKKYLQYVTARRPTSDLICQVHYSVTPAKVFNMRPDTLATMMHAANVGPHARVLCLDATGGVAAAACAERMGGTGTLCCPHAEASRYSLDYTRLLNCPRWLAQSARQCSLTALLAAQKRINSETAEEENPAKKQKTGEQGSGSDAGAGLGIPEGAPSTSVLLEADRTAQREGNTEAEPVTTAPAGDPSAVCNMEIDAPAGDCAEAVREGKAEGATTASDKEGEKEGIGERGVDTTERPIRAARAASAQLRLGKEIPEGFKIPEVMIAAGDEDIETMARQGFTSLVVVAPKLEPTALLTALLQLLNPSASVAVYASSLPPLAECFQKLQATRNFAALHIQESWWREIQVLPMRTHPTMTTSGTGGYLLTGIRVIPSERPESLANVKRQEGKLPRRKKVRG